jgi:Kef-type K+ transport system membrane component KefB
MSPAPFLFPWIASLMPRLGCYTLMTEVSAAGATDQLSASEAPLIFAGVLLSLVVIYLASKVGGEVCARLNFPPVLGELVGGVIIGVSALKLILFPENVAAADAPALLTQFLQWSAGISAESAVAIAAKYSEVLSVLAELGVVFLLFEIGLESNLRELIRVGPQAAIVAVTGVVAPFATGTLGLMYLFHLSAIPAIFAGAALTATSIGITAKVLSEIQQLNSKEGQIIIGAAVLDDVLGIIVLAVVASLAKDGEIQLSNIVYLIVSSTVFLIGSIVLGRLFSPYFVRLVEKLNTRGNLLISALIFAFILAYVSAVIHLEAILGAFAAGLILGETDKREELTEQVLPIADMLVPIFFVCVGARTDVGVLNPWVPENREGLILAVFLVAVAIVGKVVTGAVVFGKESLNRLAIGIGMIPRGEVGLVFAGVGSASGVLSAPLTAAIIVMVIFTTFLAPPLLRVVMKTPSSGVTLGTESETSL